MNKSKNAVIDQRVKEDYKYGFVTDIESETPHLESVKKQFTLSQKKRKNLLGCLLGA